MTFICKDYIISKSQNLQCSFLDRLMPEGFTVGGNTVAPCPSPECKMEDCNRFLFSSSSWDLIQACCDNTGIKSTRTSRSHILDIFPYKPKPHRWHTRISFVCTIWSQPFGHLRKCKGINWKKIDCFLNKACVQHVQTYPVHSTY